MSACNRSCKTCIFFKRNFGEEEKGECRRFPPQFAVIKIPYSTFKYYRFPKVGKYDWCGEYKNE